jgi:hypothetical protein
MQTPYFQFHFIIERFHTQITKQNSVLHSNHYNITTADTHIQHATYSPRTYH